MANKEPRSVVTARRLLKRVKDLEKCRKQEKALADSSNNVAYDKAYDAYRTAQLDVEELAFRLVEVINQ